MRNGCGFYRLKILSEEILRLPEARKDFLPRNLRSVRLSFDQIQLPVRHRNFRARAYDDLQQWIDIRYNTEDGLSDLEYEDPRPGDA